MKKKIIAIVGASGSGKTHMTKYIDNKFNLPSIVSCTTRPMREGETNGVEHYFVEEDQMPTSENILAYTKFGEHHYWTDKQQIKEWDIFCYVIDEIGLIEMLDKYSDEFEVIPVLVKRNESSLESEIDKDRRNRDKYRISLPYAFYDYIIYNAGTIEEFEKNIDILINNIKLKN
jgi:guanylate kinase